MERTYFGGKVARGVPRMLWARGPPKRLTIITRPTHACQERIAGIIHSLCGEAQGRLDVLKSSVLVGILLLFVSIILMVIPLDRGLTDFTYYCVLLFIFILKYFFGGVLYMYKIDYVNSCSK